MLGWSIPVCPLGECLHDRSFCRYRMAGIPVQIPVSMCRFSIHCGVDSMVAVRGALSVHESNASFTVRALHNELDVGIHLIYVVE